MPTAIAAAAPPADADVPAADDVSGAAAAATLFGGSAAAAEEANAAGAARGAKVPSALLFQHGSCQSSSPDLTPHFPHIQVPSAWKAAEARVESFAWHRLLNDLDPLARYTPLPTSRYPHPSTRIPTTPRPLAPSEAAASECLLLSPTATAFATLRTTSPRYLCSSAAASQRRVAARMRDGSNRETLQPTFLLLTTLLALPSSGARLAAEACAAKWEETLARLHADFHGITSRVKAHALAVRTLSAHQPTHVSEPQPDPTPPIPRFSPHV